MKREQLIKILQVAIISTAIMLVAEIIFDIPAVTNWFSWLITHSYGIWVWIAIWIIMFLQVTILNIPAYVILSASVSIGIETLSIPYILVVLSAYMAGCLFAYWIGLKFGRKAVRWCAGSDEDYDKWSSYLNKKGKLWYLVTVMFPFFPDDLLCLVAGGVKFDFGWYALSNFIGRGVGLVAMLLFLKFIGNISNGIPLMLILWAVALVAELITFVILKKRHKKETDNSNQQNEIKQNKDDKSNQSVQKEIFEESKGNDKNKRDDNNSTLNIKKNRRKKS